MSAPRIVLIHATRVAIEPIEVAFATIWPAAETVSILEEALSADLAAGRASRAELDDRIVRLADYARGLGPDGILFTCSAFGSGIEAAARQHDIPVLKPNEAMFEAAAAAGGPVAMLYTFPPSVAGLEREFREQIARLGGGGELHSILVPDALDALRAGDGARHDRLIAEAAVRASATGATVVMLAQFSMARAAGEVRKATESPVLTSPETAIERLERLVAERKRGAA